jgi:tRNA(Ile)-lysidine synthetase-like protein
LRALARTIDQQIDILIAATVVEVEPGVRAVFALGVLRRMGKAYRGQVLWHTAHERLVETGEWGWMHARQLADELEDLPHATGPHPLINGYVWSVLPACGGRPDLLCIHHADALPIEPETPWLEPPEHIATRPVPFDGETRLLSGWTLRTETIAAPATLVGASPWEAFLDADACGAPALTGWTSGQRIAPLGMAGRTRALGDIFTDNKVPTAFRPGWPVLVDQNNGRVLWLCGLVVSDAAAVTPQTRRILRLRWRKDGA